MASGRQTVESQNFVLLDGLRGLGATLVLIGHILLVLGPVVVPGGAVIVDLFFLLSGFVIAFAYEPRFADGMRSTEFMMHRIVRLYPLYLLGILLGYALLLLLAINDPDGGRRSLTLTLQFMAQAFILPAPEFLGNHNAYPFNPPAWTLFFELLINLVYVLAFRWLRDTRILAIATALCAILLAVTVFTFGGIDVGSEWKNFWAGFGRAGFGFFAGVLTFRLLGRPTTTRRPASRWAFVVLVAIPVACFLPATPEFRPFLDLFMAVGLGMPLLYISQSIEPPRQFVRLFIMGGRVSYAIYILHWPFLEAAQRMTWRMPSLTEAAPMIGFAVFVIVLPFAYFAEGLYDRPVRRWIVAKLKQRAASRIAARAAAKPDSGAAFAE